MMLLSTTLVVLFGMVVAVGHLVQARVSLQNSVDLAAMVGASYQARYLNHVALVNYRLRQNYKAMLYDLYVTSSRFNQGLVTAATGPRSGPFDRIGKSTQGIVYGICRQAFGYDPTRMGSRFIPASTRASDSTTDMCQNAVGKGKTIRPIEPYFGPIISPGLVAIAQAIVGLRGEQEKLCREAAAVNQGYYVYALDLFKQQQRFQMEQMLQLLGAFKEEFGDDVAAFDAGTTGAVHSAMYQTLVGNLIGALRPENGSGLVVEWLNPRETRSFYSSGGSDIITDVMAGTPNQDFARYFEAARVGLDVEFIDFSWSGKGCRASVLNTATTGRSQVMARAAAAGLLGTYQQPAFMGIGRSRISPNASDPEGRAVKVPFGVVLRVTVPSPKLLFWPQGLTPSLSAIGAAKPFGSRIGPPVQQVSGELGGVPSFPSESVTGGEVTMSFYPGDVSTGDARSGLGHRLILDALYRALGPAKRNGVNVVQPRSINTTECSVSYSSSGYPFLCYALAPTLYEALFFNSYPYPETRSYNYPQVGGLVSFPKEVGIAVSPRNPPIYSPERSDEYTPASHFTTALGEGFNTLFGMSPERPVFFADRKVLRSSWNPAVDPTSDDSFQSDWNVRAHDPEFPGRMGYQIKLTSVFQLCREIEKGGGVSLGRLAAFCPGAASGGAPQAGRDILH